MRPAARAADHGGDVTDDELIQRLKSIAPVRLDEPLSRHTTFGIGGPAEVFMTVRSAGELARAVVAAREAGAPIFILGAGSNILVGDRGVRGITIDNQAKATRVEPLRLDLRGAIVAPPAIEGVPAEDAFVVSAESGTSFAALARRLSRDGYSGIEWASGIPGTLGGAAVYNAGAYDGCLADVLLAVTLLGDDNQQRHLPASELRMAYRTSALLRGEFGAAVVLSVEFAVRREDPARLMARIADIDAQRLAAQPRGRNSGSTFKNPQGHHAWQLVDAVGLRGHRIGDARISERHCNFFENLGSATAHDVFALMTEARTRVKERFGIDLENEVEMIGEGF
jgi:UDP-N-acetylmuramate dehydrogenase